ncbi:MAG: hypothetical protein GC179_22420 [Anaerolineaceae bacterium]|nr:hypothetical protein [Anaerolineaceae bacterium]
MNSIIKHLRSFTPIDDLSGEFQSLYPLSTAVEHVNALEGQHYDVRGSRKTPLAFTVLIQEKHTAENGAYNTTLGSYYQTQEDIVALLDLELTVNGEKTAVRYRCHLRDGLKTKLYIHMIVIFVLVVLTISQSDAILFFGIFFLITVYTISQEWSELKNVKQGLLSLVEHELH